MKGSKVDRFESMTPEELMHSIFFFGRSESLLCLDLYNYIFNPDDYKKEERLACILDYKEH